MAQKGNAGLEFVHVLQAEHIEGRYLPSDKGSFPTSSIACNKNKIFIVFFCMNLEQYSCEENSWEKLTYDYDFEDS